MAVTPKRDIRIDEDTWARATTRARAEGTDVSKLVRAFVYDYGHEELTIGDELTRLAQRLEDIRNRLMAGLEAKEIQ